MQLGLQLLLLVHPNGFIFLETGRQLLNFVVLDLQGGLLLLLSGAEVELVVLDFSVFVLKFGVFSFQHLDLVLLHQQLLLIVSNLSLVRVHLALKLIFLVFELGTHFVQVVDLVLLDGEVGFALMGKFNIVFLEGIQFFVNSGFLFPLDETLVLVFGHSSAHVVVKFLVFEMEVLLGL